MYILFMDGVACNAWPMLSILKRRNYMPTRAKNNNNNNHNKNRNRNNNNTPTTTNI